MQNGFLTITTAVDGQESRLSCQAEMEFTALSVRIRYRDENAEVTISVDGNHAVIERIGDYGLYLPLQENARTVGRLSIGGNVGSVEIDTQKLVYSVGKNTLLMQIQYTLWFGAEKQEMRLRIHAKQNHSEEK